MRVQKLALHGGAPIRKTPIPISQPVIGQEELDNVKEVLDSKWIAQGPKVEEFENRFAKYIGTDYAVATNSGTSALHLALISLNIKSNNEILIPDITCIAVPNAVSYVSAIPRFVDVEMKTFNISIDALETSISNKTKAIIPIHLYGHPAKLEEILDFSKQHNLFIIEDCAHAHGAEYKGEKVGSFGDVGIFSTYATKNMTTSEGGVLVTNRRDIAEKARLIRNQDKSTAFPFLAYNYKMNDIEAAIGLAQLSKLDKLNESRIENAKFLSSNFEDLQNIRIPVVMNNVKHVFHRYTLFFDLRKFTVGRDEIAKALEAEGIRTGVLYTPPAHCYSYYKNKYNFKDKEFKNAELISKGILSIPVHPNLARKDLDDIITAVNKVVTHFAKKV